MTSNIRFDSMDLNKQILLDLFLSFGTNSNKQETVLKFISELKTKLGLNLAAFLAVDESLNCIKGGSTNINLKYSEIVTLAKKTKTRILEASSIKDKELNKILNSKDQHFIYLNQDNSLILLSSDKNRNLFQENTLVQLLDRFNFFINNLAEDKINQPIDTALQKDRLLHKVIEQSEQNILVLNKDLVIQHFNTGSAQAIKQSFGIELILGENLFEEKESEFKKVYKPLMKRALAGEEIKFNFTSNEKDNEIAHQYSVVTFKPIKSEKNEIIGLISFTKNVTELVKINRQLEKRESTLNTILDSTPDGIFSVDKNLKLLVINEQARQDFKDYGNVDLKTGDNLHDKIEKKILDKWKEKYFNRIFNNESFVVNSNMKNKIKNQTSCVENRYLPVKDNEGKIFAAIEVCRDITELKNKEHSLELKEKELRNLLENTPTGIAKIGLDGNVKFITKRACNLLGLKKSEIIGHSIFEFIHPSSKKLIIKDISRLIQGENEVSNTYRGINPHKEDFHISGIASVIKDLNDKPLEFLLAFNDISDELQAQHGLIKSRKKYYSILHGSPSGLAQVNDKGQFIFVSKRGAEILESDTETILTKSFLDFISDHHKEVIVSNLEKLTQPDQVIEFRVKGRSDKGKVFYLDGTATLLIDDEIGMSTLYNFNDVTSRVLAEKELAIYNAEIQEKSAIYKALIDNSFDGIEIIEFTSEKAEEEFGAEIIIRNEKMNEYFGKSTAPLIAIDDILNISPDKQSNGLQTKDVFQHVINENQQGRLAQTDWRFYINNKLEDFQFSSNVIKLEDKTILIRNLRKITEMKQHQETIKDQLNTLSLKNEELQKYIQSNLQLENFAYIASHDLKAPLRTVSSFSFLLKQKAYETLDEKSKGYLDIILRSSTNMLSLIDDLLEFSRVGTQKIKYKEIALGPMIKRILLDLNSNIIETKAEIFINDLPEVIIADESMMIQVFLNLISNCLKFTQDEITPIVEIGFKDSKSHWEFNIKDNGIGVKEENIKKIFGIFEKLHSNDVYEGTGLGLSICKKIIEIHQGEIKVESELGKGSNFIFSIKKNLISEN